MTKVFLYLAVLNYVFVSTSYGNNPKTKKEEQASNIVNSVFLRKGKPAPFSGRLIKEFIVINMLADIKFDKKRCAMELEFTKNICLKNKEYVQLKCKKEIQYTKEELSLELNFQKKKYEKIIKIKDAQIKSLEKIAVDAPKTLLQKMKDSSFWFGLGVGVITGVITTAAVIYSLEKQ